MTKISKKSAYPIKNPVVGDFFVGTDSENNNKTVSFGFEYAANLINRINGSLIINYMFKTDVNIPLAVLTQGHFLSQDNNTDINTVTKLYVNKTNFQEDDLSDLFLFIKENTGDYYFKLQNSENLINAVYFNINSIVAYAEYFEFNIVIDKTNPSLTTLVDSKIYFFTFEIKSNITKTSDLENDGSNGTNPFITAEDLPDPVDISGKENKSEKGQANGYAPLNALVKIASTYLDIVNDLVTGGATSILSAEQGRQLQLQISAINSILFSDNVNLDTVQEIVDAIESLQGYLDTILVNDLVTGGVTKALTAEMGKTLKGLIDALTTVVNNLQADVTNIDDRLTVLENFNPPPQSGFTGQPYMVWSGIGFKHDYNLPSYYIEGVLYPASTGDITPTVPTDVNPRYVSFFVDATGVNYRLGDAQENPLLPTIDPTTEIFITSFLVLPGATTPDNVSQNVVYNEQAPEEWDFYSNHANITVGDTVDPLDGSECVNVFNSSNGTYFEFTAPEPQSIVAADGFKFWLKNIVSIASNRGFSVEFYNGTTKVSKTISFKRQSSGSSTSNPYGIVYTNTSAYQLIVIPYQDLEFEQNTYTKVRFTFIGAITVKFDYLALMQSGGGFGVSPDKKGIKTIITDNGIKTVNTSEASVVMKGIDGISTYVNENGEVEVSGITLSNRIDNYDNYGKKQYESYWRDISLTGAVTDLDISSTESTSLNFTNAITELNSVIFPPASTQPYSGKDFYIKNSQAASFLIKHEVGNIATEQRYIFSLPGEVDLELKPKQIAHFKLKTSGDRGKIELVGVVLDESNLMHLTGDEEVDGNKTFLQPVSGEDAVNPEHLVTLSQMEAADADVLQDSKDYTDAGLALKLDAADYNNRFKGKFLTEAAMRAAYPTANVGDEAQVNEVGSETVKNFSWDDELNDWVQSGSGGSGATNTDALPEGSSNLYFQTARVLATVLTGISFVTGGAIVSTDTVLQAFGKIQKQINDLTTANVTDSTNKRYVTDAQQTVIGNTSGTNSGNETASSIATINHGASAKTTLVDADEVYGGNSASSFSLIRTVWSDVWTYIKSKADTYYSPKSTTVVLINGNTTLDDTYNGKVLLLTVSATITLPNGLATYFGVTIATKPSCTLTMSLGGSVTLINNAGTTMAEKLSCTFLNTGNSNEYLTAGNL